MRFDRIKKLQKKLNLPYFTDDSSELIYLCGYKGSFGALLVLEHDFVFFTDSRYYGEYKDIFGKNIYQVKNSLINGLKEFVKKEKIKELKINAKRVTYDTYLNIKKELPDTELITDNETVMSMRVLKDRTEIQKIKKAITIAEDAFLYIIKFLKPGISERDAAVELEYVLKLKGALDTAFKPIILFGERSAFPHGVPSHEVKLQHGHVVLIDMGANFENYNSDMTRTFCFGKIPQGFKEIYKIVLEAQLRAFNAIKPGVDVNHVDKAARDYISQNKLGEYFQHGLGHGIGIEVHEQPRISYLSKGKLKTGMVFSNEPGVYLPGKFGIRIEDMVVLRSESPQWLTDLPKQKIICI